MMTQPEIDALALRVGVTREKFPEFFVLSDCCTCGDKFYECTCGNLVRTWICNLPDPLSDDPRACLWEPFYMRALGWPGIKRTQLRLAEPPIVYEVTNIDGRIYPTGNPTAALLAAYQAKEAPDATH